MASACISKKERNRGQNMQIEKKTSLRHGVDSPINIQGHK